MSRLIQLMDVWLQSRGDQVAFTTQELVELTKLLKRASITFEEPPKPIEDPIPKAEEEILFPMPEEQVVFESYYQQLIAEKKHNQRDIDLQHSLSLRYKIDWKYYRRNKHLINTY